MKAIVYTGKGRQEGLILREVAKPEPRENEVLVSIHAATVTPSDIDGMGFLRLLRPLRGLSRRPDLIPGVEFAGVIEAAGAKVRAYKAGDRVFGSAGTALGAWAEFLCLPEDGVLAPIPDNMGFDEAAGLCDSALTALHFLMNKAKAESGQSVLINGAAGSVGGCAVQVAASLGCRVTGICSAGNTDHVLRLGAQRVIDYAKEDFTKAGQPYDIVFDAVAKSSFGQCKGILNAGGLYLSTVPTPSVLLSMMLTRFGGGKRALFAAAGLARRGVKREALRRIEELVRAGQLAMVVDRRFPFEGIAEALAYVAAGHKKGSLIIAPL